MDKIKALIAAVRESGLARIIVGERYVDVAVNSDAQLSELAVEFKTEPRAIVSGERSWNGFDVRLDGLFLSVTGPHRIAKEEAA